MWQKLFLYCLFFYASYSAIAQKVEYKISKAEIKNKNISINEVINSYSFDEILDGYALNFGITNATHWIKIQVKNLDTTHTYLLNIACITPDSIQVFEQIGRKIKTEFIGEGFYSPDRFLNYHFTPLHNEAIFYLKVIGNGQPISLPIKFIDNNNEKPSKLLFYMGIIYGMIAAILVLNLILYFNTLEKLYLYILFYNIFSTGVLLYFEGFIKLIFIPNSLYWNNMFITIALSLSYVVTNLYIPEFLKIKSYSIALNQVFKTANYIILIIMGISFFHPFGLKFYILANAYMVTIEAFLLFGCVMYIRNKEKDYFFIQLTAVLMLIVFGTVSQLYLIGRLPINLFTQDIIYFMVLPQILVQSFALGKRLTLIVREKSALQDSILKLSKQHSQSLIIILEKERKRISSEFHDSIGQNILVMRNRILLMLKKNILDLQLTKKLHDLANLTSETLDEIRSIARDLRPSTIDTIGITVSLQQMVKKIKLSTPIKIQFDCKSSIDNILPKDMEINFYRILQELFNNLLKHSQAIHANITIQYKQNILSVQFEDDGTGFDMVDKMGEISNGLTGIHERVDILNGTIKIESTLNKGTLVIIDIPTT